ncbi:MAG TPA: hypothetical protein HPQ04_14350 [Rhodospirillaceae bacterium]|nr:hypothetical protein [Rhodospirillaceae bacterium]
MHLVVSLSPHGFGHAAMTAPVVNALRRRLPGLRLTLQTTLPAALLASRFDGPYQLIPEIADFGLRQASATEVLAAETLADYRALHGRLDAEVSRDAERLKALRADLLLANIPYVPLLAAERAGVPAIALSCLNWAAIYRHYFADQPDTGAITGAMLRAYSSAELFLCPQPCLPMGGLANLRPIGPVGRYQPGRAGGLARRLGLPAGQRAGVIAFGGMGLDLPLHRWPRLPGWRWVVPGDAMGHPDIIAAATLDLPFGDLMTSCDLLITKPGYATFVEAGLHGIPVLSVNRPDWPETPILVDWLSRHGRCRAVETAELFDAGGLEDHLRWLFSLPVKPLVVAEGIAQAVAEIEKYLRS